MYYLFLSISEPAAGCYPGPGRPFVWSKSGSCGRRLSDPDCLWMPHFLPGKFEKHAILMNYSREIFIQGEGTLPLV